MQDLTRRDVVKAAGVAGAAAALTQIVGAPAIVKAAPEQVKYGVIGTGGRGGYLVKHLAKIDNGHCAAICDLDPKKMDQVSLVIGTNPSKYKDYRELLADKNVDAVIIAVPLFEHYKVTKDAIDAGFLEALIEVMEMERPVGRLAEKSCDVLPRGGGEVLANLI